MLKVEIKSSDTNTRQKKDKSGSYQTQKGYAFVSDRNGLKPYPEEVTLFVPKVNGNPVPYEPGIYELSADSIRVGQYGSIEIGFINLVPYQKKS